MFHWLSALVPDDHVVFHPRVFACDGGTEHCHHPAPYEVRDLRHRVRFLCIKHLTEYRYQPPQRVA